MMRNYQFSSVKYYLTSYNSIINLTNTEISNINPTNNITIDFIEFILPYHNSCIHICNNILNFAKKDFITNFAKEVINYKRKEIEELKLVNHTTYGFINQEKNVQIYLNENKKIFEYAKEKQINIFNNSSNSIFLNFKAEILTHFEFGKKLCQNVLQYYIDARLRVIAENTIKNYDILIKKINEL